eukprot:313812_1
METLLILVSITSSVFGTTSMLSFAVSTSSLAQSNPHQIIKFRHFADSQLFGLLYKTMDAENIQHTFGNFNSIQITKSPSACITLSPGEPFIKIGNILGHLYAHGCNGQKNGDRFQKMVSEIMGIIY